VEGVLGDNLYANDALPAVSLKSEAETLAEYYKHPEFILMSRAIYTAQVNFPADLTDFLRLFIIF